jgi:hypothetical protein
MSVEVNIPPKRLPVGLTIEPQPDLVFLSDEFLREFGQDILTKVLNDANRNS